MGRVAGTKCPKSTFLLVLSHRTKQWHRRHFKVTLCVVNSTKQNKAVENKVLHLDKHKVTQSSEWESGVHFLISVLLFLLFYIILWCFDMVWESLETLLNCWCLSLFQLPPLQVTCEKVICMPSFITTSPAMSNQCALNEAQNTGDISGKQVWVCVCKLIEPLNGADNHRSRVITNACSQISSLMSR